MTYEPAGTRRARGSRAYGPMPHATQPHCLLNPTISFLPRRVVFLRLRLPNLRPKWSGLGRRDGSIFKIPDLTLPNTTTFRIKTTMGKLNRRKDCGWDPPTAMFPKIKSHSWASRSDERHRFIEIIKGTTSTSLRSLFWWKSCRNKVTLDDQMSSPLLLFHCFLTFVL